MNQDVFRFIYHDGLAHYDKEAWLEVGDFAGWAVVECNCTLITKHSSVEQKLPRQSHNLEITSANLVAATIEEE